MKTCTFFGHRDCPDSVYPLLRNTIINLIENNNVLNFYVGNHGNFDSLVIKIFKELLPVYPNIKFFVVLAYMPSTRNLYSEFILRNSIFPEGIETIPKRFAISHRNRWLVNNSDILVTYVTHSSGGAAQFSALAEKKHKQIINLS